MKQNLPLFTIQEAINSYAKTQAENISADLAMPTYVQHGDLTTNIALRLSKITKTNPSEIAQDIKKYLEEKTIPGIEKIEIAGPGLINIFLNNTARKDLINSILENKDIFKLDTDKNSHWVIEHTSPNPNKAMHLGHLRNNLVGMSISNMLENSGARVTRDAVDNNRGIAIAKAMYGFLSLEKKNKSTETNIQDWVKNPEHWYTPQEKDMRPDVFITNCYTGGEELRKNDTAGEIDKIIRQMVLDWEEKDQDTWKLWQHILNYSYAGMEITLKRLGNKWDKVWHEHEHYQRGKDYVEKGLKKGVFKKLDDGAVLTQIEERYGIPETILLKNDGSALYITQDIALTDLKKKTYNADKLIWVIGPEQTLAMEQLFAVCEDLGIGKREDFIHIPYGYMGLKDETGNFKKMSSRAGTVLLIDDLLDTVKEKIKTARGEKEITEDSLEKIALAATKFSILKCEKNMNMAFDVNESVNLTGDSGVYVLYTHARINSILREGELQGIQIESKSGESAINVVRMINSYPITLMSAREHLSVHPIAHYLLSLCATFNKFYGEEKVLDGGENMSEKLAVLLAVNKVIEHGLNILGIQTVEKM
jgi:arginyl-tRNA synthetase